jgi:hypothetical protein
VVLFRLETLQQIRQGTVSLAFRRWRQQRVRAGSRQRTAIGVVEITAVTAISDAQVSDADAMRAGYSSADTLLADFPPTDERTLFKIELRYAGPDPRVSLRERPVNPDELESVLNRLDRWDRSARRGPWTRRTLRLIAEHPGRRAPDLAQLAGYETTLAFKRDVRKLKELGLTESLEVGYRLSPRGRTVVDGLGGIG